jgi:hypothetical protein
MTPQELIDTKVAACVGHNPHVWEPSQLFCPTCGHHEGFGCLWCHRVVDAEQDTPLYEAIVEVLRRAANDD